MTKLLAKDLITLEQQIAPAVVADVLSVLSKMGYSLVKDSVPLPEAEVGIAKELRPEDLRVEEILSRGEGGFSPLRANGVRVTHLPTGISAECTEHRSAHRNRAQALILLEQALASTPAFNPAKGDGSDLSEAAKLVTAVRQAESNGEALGLVLAYRYRIRERCSS